MVVGGEVLDARRRLLEHRQAGAGLLRSVEKGLRQRYRNDCGPNLAPRPPACNLCVKCAEGEWASGPLTIAAKSTRKHVTKVPTRRLCPGGFRHSTGKALLILFQYLLLH